MREPPYSCPYLDSAINAIEEARTIHDNLRTWGQHWKDEFESLEEHSSIKIGELEKEISRLEGVIYELSKEIKESVEPH